MRHNKFKKEKFLANVPFNEAPEENNDDTENFMRCTKNKRTERGWQEKYF